MNNKNSSVEDRRQQLRQRAEKNLQEHAGETTTLTKEDLRHLVHELQVHQIELTMQNEELLHTQEQLSDSREQYLDLYNNAPVGYLTLDKKGHIVQANHTFTQMLVASQEEVLSRPLTQFIHYDDQDIFYIHRRQVLNKRVRQTCELRLNTSRGDQFYAQFDTVMSSEEGQNDTYRIVVTDVTQRKQFVEALRESKLQLEQTLAQLTEAQAQMIARERLAAVGQLAAGIAHDFNNILAVIQIHADLLLRPDISSDTWNRKLHIIQQQVSHASSLTQQILDFSRVKMLNLKRVDLHDFLPEVANVLQVALPDSILFSLRVLVEKCPVRVDADRLQQVLLNLAINAREAMPTGGSLHILCDIERVNGPPSPSSNHSDGPWAKISIRDTGTGIKDDVLPFIFEPFFTTRGPSGSGLGLAQVFGIIKQHNGSVTVESKEGIGSTFTIWLPLLPETDEVERIPDERDVERLSAASHHHEATIALVDDNAMLRDALSMALEILGYNVLSFSNARDVVDFCKQKDANLSLVITDLEMPEMSGMELAQELNQDFPDIKIIILSGYSSDHMSDELQGVEDICWLQKPIELNVIGKVVSEILEA